jgi:hypothetical protein
MATIRSTSKISRKWVRQTRKYFLPFLHTTHFPSVERHGQRGKTFDSPVMANPHILRHHTMGLNTSPLSDRR